MIEWQTIEGQKELAIALTRPIRHIYNVSLNDIDWDEELKNMFIDDEDFEIVPEPDLVRKCDCPLVQLLSIGCKCGGI